MTSWRPDDDQGWGGFPAPLWAFWTERHLTTLTTLRADGSPHVVPVGVALDAERRCAWVITNRASVKVGNLRRDPRLAAAQVDGRRWSTLEGTATVVDDAAEVARAVERYASRYRTPRPNPERVALRITVSRILHSGVL